MKCLFGEMPPYPMVDETYIVAPLSRPKYSTFAVMDIFQKTLTNEETSSVKKYGKTDDCQWDNAFKAPFTRPI